MKISIPALLVLPLLTGPVTTYAAISFSTDTATNLVGTFSVSGTTVEAASPAVFDFGLSFCTPVRVSRSNTATIGLQCAGAPDDPRVSVQVAGAQAISSVSGTVNALAGSTVPTFYFYYSDMQDTGGTSGTFSGAFCFSRSQADCGSVEPEPEPATLHGFYPPVDPPSVATNSARAGQTIPLRFHAQTSSGPITDLTAAILAITGVPCGNLSTATDVVDESPSDAGVALQNLGGGYYQFNWKTGKADAGTCKTVTLSLPAPYTSATRPVAAFRFSGK